MLVSLSRLRGAYSVIIKPCFNRLKRGLREGNENRTRMNEGKKLSKGVPPLITRIVSSASMRDVPPCLKPTVWCRRGFDGTLYCYSHFSEEMKRGTKDNCAVCRRAVPPFIGEGICMSIIMIMFDWSTPASSSGSAAQRC
ncbi:hypothetical protein TIFTF001_010587 [Ficus carica]|uniref:Uncharacterized protein n=1 Tax=Ficus carica TaxID=3494 RepID=A0AA88D257_FICCA|nr:hypothetical protein TIFTF001_010587 [Ficus carica]